MIYGHVIGWHFFCKTVNAKSKPCADSSPMPPYPGKINPCLATIKFFMKTGVVVVIAISNSLRCNRGLCGRKYYIILYFRRLCRWWWWQASEVRRDGGSAFCSDRGPPPRFYRAVRIVVSSYARAAPAVAKRAIERAFELTTNTKRLLLRRRVRRPRCGGGRDVRPSSESAPNRVVGGRCRVVHALISPRVRWPGPAAARATRARTHAHQRARSPAHR